MGYIFDSHYWLVIYIIVGLSALYLRCTLKDDISYLLPT